MDLIPGISTTGLIGLLPLAVLVLICASGYLIVKRGRTDVVDSPWFWAFAFSAIGLLGVWAISGKYDDRQKRLEARYEARGRIAERQRGGASEVSTEPLDAATTSRNDVGDDSRALSTGYSHDRQVPLHFLAAGLLLVSFASVIMLWRNLRT